MGETIRIGVTGVGGGCGQAIMKALSIAMIHDAKLELFPADISPLAIGLHRAYGRGQVLPKPEVDIETWEEWVRANELRIIFPGSDHDLLPLAQNREFLWDKWGCSVVVSREQPVRMVNDKLETIRVLKGIGDIVPDTSFSTRWADVLIYAKNAGFPLVVKPRFGMTSRGVQVVSTLEELKHFWHKTVNPVVQKYVDGNEYTATVTHDWHGFSNATIVLRRTLYAGATYVSEPVFDDSISSFLLGVCSVLRKTGYRFFGGLNFQFKIDNGKVRIFELNGRSSGSTAIRAMFGYNEPAMMVNHIIKKVPIAQPRIKSGVCLRYWDEGFIFDTTVEDLMKTNRIHKAIIPSLL